MEETKELKQEENYSKEFKEEYIDNKRGILETKDEETLAILNSEDTLEDDHMSLTKKKSLIVREEGKDTS